MQEYKVELEDIKQKRRDYRKSQAKLRHRKEKVEISRMQNRNKKTLDSQQFRGDLGGRRQTKHKWTPDNYQIQRDQEDLDWVGEGMGSQDN